MLDILIVLVVLMVSDVIVIYSDHLVFINRFYATLTIII